MGAAASGAHPRRTMKANATRRRRHRRVVPPDAATPRLPHDRDELPETQGAPRRIIAQAHADLAAGRVDTDNYTRAREITRRALAESRRRR